MINHICKTHKSADNQDNIEIMRSSEPTVEGNLAIDESLAREAGLTGRRVLRLWWGSGITAVLGCADKPEKSLNLDNCARLGVGWVKRITGGGTVLQTHGVFNYSYTAPSYGRLDMQQVFSQGADLIVSVLSDFGVNARQRGISDVAVGDFKISGNAQARKWHAILLHGTILVDVDFDLVEAILRHPAKEPEYRRHRPHKEFLTTLRDLGMILPKAEIEAAFAQSAAIFS
ncbi:MAG: lipoate--protein ligase family protein [Armatimonadota bacterium]